MPKSPSNECNSPILNWTELQRGHARRSHSTLGSQFGHVIAATFMRNFLPAKRQSESSRNSVCGAGI